MGKQFFITAKFGENIDFKASIHKMTFTPKLTSNLNKTKMNESKTY